MKLLFFHVPLTRPTWSLRVVFSRNDGDDDVLQPAPSFGSVASSSASHGELQLSQIPLTTHLTVSFLVGMLELGRRRRMLGNQPEGGQKAVALVELHGSRREGHRGIRNRGCVAGKSGADLVVARKGTQNSFDGDFAVVEKAEADEILQKGDIEDGTTMRYT